MIGDHEADASQDALISESPLVLPELPAPRSRVRAAIVALGQLAVQVVFPDVCAGCGSSGWWLCPMCAERVELVTPDRRCDRCGSPQETGTAVCQRCDGWSDALDQVRSVYVFGGPIREMVHLLKYRGEFARAPWCAEQMWRSFGAEDVLPSIVVPVPLHRSRLKKRGFNQSERIAVELSKRSGISHDAALMRWRATRPQVDLDADKRAENVQGAFVARRMLEGQDVLLIDDVVTTGNTLEACARACRDVGAVRVRALTLATAR